MCFAYDVIGKCLMDTPGHIAALVRLMISMILVMLIMKNSLPPSLVGCNNDVGQLCDDDVHDIYNRCEIPSCL